MTPARSAQSQAFLVCFSLSDCLSGWLSLCLSLYVWFSLAGCLCVCLSLSLSVSVCLPFSSLHLSVCLFPPPPPPPSHSLSVCLSVCLPFSSLCLSPSPPPPPTPPPPPRPPSLSLSLSVKKQMQEGQVVSKRWRKLVLQCCLLSISCVISSRQAFRPEWYISTMTYIRDMPFWSETLAGFPMFQRLTGFSRMTNVYPIHIVYWR